MQRVAVRRGSSLQTTNQPHHRHGHQDQPPPRPVIYGYELSPKEAARFDYLAEDELPFATFFRYRGEVYDLNEFVRIVRPHQCTAHGFGHHDHENAFIGWDAICTDSFFSGIVVRFVDDGEAVVVGTAFC